MWLKTLNRHKGYLLFYHTRFEKSDNLNMATFQVKAQILKFSGELDNHIFIVDLFSE